MSSVSVCYDYDVIVIFFIMIMIYWIISDTKPIHCSGQPFGFVSEEVMLNLSQFRPLWHAVWQFVRCNEIQNNSQHWQSLSLLSVHLAGKPVWTESSWTMLSKSWEGLTYMNITSQTTYREEFQSRGKSSCFQPPLFLEDHKHFFCLLLWATKRF